MCEQGRIVVSAAQICNHQTGWDLLESERIEQLLCKQGNCWNDSDFSHWLAKTEGLACVTTFDEYLFRYVGLIECTQTGQKGKEGRLE